MRPPVCSPADKFVCGGIENDIVTYSLHDAIRRGEELYAKDTGRSVEEDNVCTFIEDNGLDLFQLPVGVASENLKAYNLDAEVIIVDWANGRSHGVAVGSDDADEGTKFLQTGHRLRSTQNRMSDPMAAAKRAVAMGSFLFPTQKHLAGKFLSELYAHN